MTTLNSEQKRAVETTEGPLLIIAGAGSGKTSTITHRIIHLIRKGVAPHQILAITFTNKSAKEMRDRVYKLLEDDKTLNIPISMTEKPFVSTFHALGVHIIRENAGLIGLTRHFTIYDRSDSKRSIKDAMLQTSVDPKKFEPGVILNLISRAKGDGLNRLEYSNGVGSKDFIKEVVLKVWEKYEAILLAEKALDFDDLLLKTAELLKKYPDVLEHYSKVWKYIHIDEYQDTNGVQYAIAKLLANKNKNICVVGDADQNIYSWRGATIENILNFEADYPGANVILLEKNYRSTKTILSAANNIIEKNTIRKKKTLYTENSVGEKISLIISYSETEEARAIADQTRTLIASGIPQSEIAVLYRANFQSRAIEDAFIKKNIPYQLVGIKFFERKEIKDVLSYIRAALNRDSLSDISRIINVPTRGIGKVTVAKVLSKREDLLPPTMKVKILQFWKLLDDIHNEILSKKPSEAVKFVIQETGIEKNFMKGSSVTSSDLDETDEDYLDKEERLLNIRELVSVATQYDHMTPEEGIEALLSNAALATDQDELEKENNAVKLMTVHASKGLEFKCVFIAGLEENLFPFKHIDEDGISKAEQEEERRLFYVALTRAKEKLYLSHAILRTIYGSQRVSAPSEFITDIAPELIEQHIEHKPSGAKAIFIDF